MTQNNLGSALAEKGSRIAGAAGISLLAQAVAAYRQALEVRTRSSLPQGWAMTQTNLGSVLAQQGYRISGAEGTKLLGEAAVAFRQALEVYTRSEQPQRWAIVVNNLAQTYLEMKEWANYVDCLEELAFATNDHKKYEAVLSYYRDVVKNILKVYDLERRWREKSEGDIRNNKQDKQ